MMGVSNHSFDRQRSIESVGGSLKIKIKTALPQLEWNRFWHPTRQTICFPASAA
jgi:hypothetical protein